MPTLVVGLAGMSFAEKHLSGIDEWATGRVAHSFDPPFRRSKRLTRVFPIQP